jgi:uncharacterized membrane protein (DUF485 family)
MNVWDRPRVGISFFAGPPAKKEDTMLRTRNSVSLVFLIYVVIGLVVAWQKAYITVPLLKQVLSALLAVFLWFLVLLGVNLRIS